MINIFIGYDILQPISFHVCVDSLIKTSTMPLQITPLCLTNLNKFKNIQTDSSNQFTYSRFLVPSLMNYKGIGVYMDCDMVVKTDIKELVALFSLSNKAIGVVKHKYKSKFTKKYLNNLNENYPKKNWSSLIVWNCGHIKNKQLTFEFVEKNTGKFLHRFMWLDDEDIQPIPIEWNWLVEEYPINNNSKILHYTIGIPPFRNNYNDHFNDWYNQKNKMLKPL